MSDIHDDLMESAYKKYNKSKKEWYESLTIPEKSAVLLGNFNYQVCNGCVIQWIWNGYCLDILELISVLEKMDTETTRTILKLLKKILPKIDLTAEDDGFSGEYLLKPLGLNKTITEFQIWFYSGASEQFLSDCLEYLTKISETEE